MQCAAAGARPKSRAVNCTSPTSSLLAGQKGEKYSTGQIIALRALMTSLRINQYKNVDLDGWRPTSAAEQRCMMRGALQEGLEARCSCRRNAMQASCSLRLRPQRPQRLLMLQRPLRPVRYDHLQKVYQYIATLLSVSS